MKKNLWLGMLALVLVFGMTVNAYAQNRADQALNGTWVFSRSYVSVDGERAEIPIDQNFRTTYNNGNFETIIDGALYSRGTYTTSNGEMTMITTGIHGLSMELEPRWYSQEELKRLLTDELDVLLIEMAFISGTASYSISLSRDILTLTSTEEYEGKIIYRVTVFNKI